MGWTTPITWTVGQIVGASDLNTHIRDNETYLFSGRGMVNLGYILVAGDLIITANTFQDFDSANITMTINVNSGRAEGWWTGSWNTSNTGNNGRAWISTRLDGTNIDGSTNVATLEIGQARGIANFSGSVPFAFAGLSVASHTFRLVGRTDGTAGAQVKLVSDTNQMVVRGSVWEL